MGLFQKKYIFLLLLTFSGLSNAVYAQKIVIREADSSWMGKEIPAKALAEKKFTFNRRWFQNLVTRFNYYYNARQTLQKTLSQAAAMHEDNYDSLLTFYPYAPTDFQSLKSSLDSVVINAGIGIEVHDPRGKWIDDLYLLVGKANYYQQNEKEAIAAFEYMIKNLGEHDEMGRPVTVGSRSFQSEKNISIVTPEKKSKAHPPARNDAFIWLIRANLDSGLYDKATALINILKNDPALPHRLQAPLYAVEAQYHLGRGQVDSALTPLRLAINGAEDKALQARWQFILSQLYEKEKRWDKAIAGYARVTAYKPSPLMQFYTRLNQTRIRVLQNLANFSTSSQPLLDMAEKERYARYRSIIYYSLGKLALQAGHPEKGIAYLQKSLLFNPKKQKVHFQAFSLLADFFYDHRQYRLAKNYYDSATAIAPAQDPQINLRKENLTAIVKNLDVIEREDSLQSLAGMPHDSLMAFLDKIVTDSLHERRKRNRILKGPSHSNGGLFGRRSEEEEEKTDKGGGVNWYFYNNVAKAKGFSAFKAQWGDRPLADNWRLSNPSQPIRPALGDNKPVLAAARDTAQKNAPSDALLKQLLEPLPLTPEALKKSKQQQMEARHDNINTFFLQLEDDTATLAAIGDLLKFHPENPYLADSYYKRYLIYSRIPDFARAAHYKQLLLSRFPDSKYAAVFHVDTAEAEKKALDKTVTQLYDKAYISYLTGDYQKVSVFRDSALYLDPQNQHKARFSLLHAMTVLKTESDSAGEVALRHVIMYNTTDTPIVDQAKRILDELRHKKELVEHLMHLQLPASDVSAGGSLAATDSLQEKRATVPGIQAIATNKTLRENKAGALKSPAQSGDVNRPRMDSLQKARLEAMAARQLAANEEKSAGRDSATVAARVQTAPQVTATPYKVERRVPYFVVLSFRKVDGDLIKNTLQSFVDYNRQYHKADSIEVSSYVLAHNQVLLIFRLFKNESDAILYYKEIKQKAPVGIIREVNPAYYRLFFISRDNFILLNNSQDFEGYLSFFYKHYK